MAALTDLDTLARWLDRYAEAWRSNDADTIGALFTDDAVYHNVFLVRLDDAGRCSDFVEYFMQAP